MTTTQNKHWILWAGAVAGVALVCAGLYLAALSNPNRFPLDDLRGDRQILLFAASGFACTIAGIGMLLMAVSSTTKSMPPEKRRKTNIGVGIGFVLQLAGLFLATGGEVRALVGLPLILASVPLSIWGCMNYAEGKGHSKWVGLAGVAGLIGLVILMVLPGHNEGLCALKQDEETET